MRNGGSLDSEFTHEQMIFTVADAGKDGDLCVVEATGESQGLGSNGQQTVLPLNRFAFPAWPV